VTRRTLLCYALVPVLPGREAAWTTARFLRNPSQCEGMLVCDPPWAAPAAATPMRWPRDSAARPRAVAGRVVRRFRFASS